MLSIPKFVLPDRSVVEKSAGPTSYSYALYNYYGKGPIAAAKRRRFQRALSLGAEAAPNAQRVMDMGCADGLLLPSLARQYRSVVAVDVDETSADRSEALRQALNLDNVQVLCNSGVSTADLRTRVGSDFQLMFLLETLEHVGAQPDMWGTKIQFLHDCFSLMTSDGRIVISVPKMVGWVMLYKNVLQRSLGMGHDALTWRQLLRSSILRDTDDLEPLWAGHHVGFNHLKLDKHLAQAFAVLRREESAISVFYVLGRKNAASS